MKKITVKQTCFIGIMAALVYATSAFLQIPIPTAIGSTRLHMGNVMCLLSGLLLGPVQGGLAAVGIAGQSNSHFLSSCIHLCRRISYLFQYKINFLYIQEFFDEFVKKLFLFLDFMGMLH